jgi:hypothetical protein
MRRMVSLSRFCDSFFSGAMLLNSTYLAFRAQDRTVDVAQSGTVDMAQQHLTAYIFAIVVDRADPLDHGLREPGRATVEQGH